MSENPAMDSLDRYLDSLHDGGDLNWDPFRWRPVAAAGPAPEVGHSFTTCSLSIRPGPFARLDTPRPRDLVSL